MRATQARHGMWVKDGAGVIGYLIMGQGGWTVHTSDGPRLKVDLKDYEPDSEAPPVNPVLKDVRGNDSIKGGTD